MKKFWIARDKDGRLYLYTLRPVRINEKGYFRSNFELRIDSDLFSEVTWENSPVEVELKIK